MSEISFTKLVKYLKSKKVYMMIGNGTKNQFRDMRKVKKIFERDNQIDTSTISFCYISEIPLIKRIQMLDICLNYYINYDLM